MLACMIEGASALALNVREFQRRIACLGAAQTATDPFIDPNTGQFVAVTGMAQSCYIGLNDSQLPHPYLGHSYVPFALANIYFGNNDPESPQGLYTDQYGFVHNGDPFRDLRVKAPNTVRIMLLGGSTAEGADAVPSNSLTITAQIERILNGRFPDIEFQVISAAQAGYSTVQNFLNMSLYLFDEYDPDVVIDLEGRNDWYRSVQTREYVKYYNGTVEMADWGMSGPPDQSLNRLDELWAGVNRSSTALLFGKFARRLGWDGQDTQVKVVADASEAEAFNAGATSRGYGAIDQERFFYGNHHLRQHLSYRREGLEAYLNMLTNLEGVCWQRQVHCLLVLQPTLGGTDREFSARDLEILRSLPYYSGWLESLRPFYERAREEFRNRARESRNTYVSYLDLAAMFDDVEGQMYHDSSHYLEPANQMLAEHLARAIAERVDLESIGNSIK
jgi:hypothetical protein